MEREEEEEVTKNERPIFLLSLRRRSAPPDLKAADKMKVEEKGGKPHRPSDLFIDICISRPCLLFFLCFWLVVDRRSMHVQAGVFVEFRYSLHVWWRVVVH